MFPNEEASVDGTLTIIPYKSDYKDNGTNILLDANENAYGPGLALSQDGKNLKSQTNGTSAANGTTDGHDGHGIDIDFLGLNRYPDPHQEDLKTLLCKLRNTHTHTKKNLTPANLFVGVGSDEAIDAIIRCFCVPGKDKILTCPPTYGMYAVSAQVNDVAVTHIPLLVDQDFALDTEGILEKLSSPEGSSIKLVYVCSPGNPTGTSIPKSAIEPILRHPTWNGVVIYDSAYIDFAPPEADLAEWVVEWPNLLVMQTLSKAFGLAGIRLGAAFTSPEIAQLLNNMKAPYNIANPTSQIAIAALQPQNLAVMRQNRENIIAQRERLLNNLPQVPGIGNFKGGVASNFLLVEILDKPRDQGGKPDNVTALKVYERLAEQRGVVVRFRGKELGCTGCLRITVGTEKEVTRFLEEIETVLRGCFEESGSLEGLSKAEEEKKEVEANEVLA